MPCAGRTHSLVYVGLFPSTASYVRIRIPLIVSDTATSHTRIGIVVFTPPLNLDGRTTHDERVSRIPIRRRAPRSLADALFRGVTRVTGVSGGMFEIRGQDVQDGRFANTALMEALDRSDGIIFGCATYMGSGSAIFKAFLEAAFQPHWLEQRWKDKVAAGFTNSASQSGDKLSTLLQLSVFAMQMGMIWVGVSDLPGNNWSGGARSDLNRLGSWVGAMGQSNADEDASCIDATAT